MSKQVRLENIIEATVSAELLDQNPAVLLAASELDEARARIAERSRRLGQQLVRAAEHLESGGNLIPSDFAASSALEQLQREIGQLEVTQTMMTRLGRAVLGRELWDDVLKAYEEAVLAQRGAVSE